MCGVTQYVKLQRFDVAFKSNSKQMTIERSEASVLRRWPMKEIKFNMWSLYRLKSIYSIVPQVELMNPISSRSQENRYSYQILCYHAAW